MLVLAKRQQQLELLLDRVAEKDMRAFRELYVEVASRLLAITTNILRDSQIAEDALQEAMLRIWRNADRYDAGKGAPLAWMGVIARNAALDMVNRRPPAELLEKADTLEFATLPVDPPDSRLWHCLRRLPPEQANAILTMYTYGLSHSELAEQLMVPLGTVKSWVRRGMLSLKEYMEQ
jgi:RNA polymerase sigma-70 factor, ECF subfamily